MSERKTELADGIDDLALQTIMLETGDLMALGSVLQRLEGLEKLADDLPSVKRLIHSLTNLVEKIALNELPAPQEGLDLLGQGLKFLQGRVSRPEADGPVAEEDVFWKKMAVHAGEIVPGGDGAAEEKREPSRAPEAMFQDPELYRDFVSESLEHLAAIELHILNLEQSPSDKDCINAIFRPFHTIKGVAGFLDLHEIHTFSHAMESLLDLARNGKLQVNQEIIDFILEAVDVLKHLISELKDQVDQGQVSPPVDLTPYLERMAAFQEGKVSGTVSTGAGRRQGSEPAPPPLGEILCGKGVVSPEKLEEALSTQDRSAGGLKLGQILVQNHEVKPKEVIEALRDQKRIISQASEASVKVDTLKLDTLVDLVGELVIAQSLVQQNPILSSLRDQTLSRDLHRVRRITTELQRMSMSLRMVPIRYTFQKMIRLVRDLAKKSGKRAELVMVGEETEIDRNMVDRLYDPLVHVIRNAVDHGIEPPEQRRAQGKPETGQVLLKAYQNGGNVVIEIEDDGQGLNRDRILRKARERGLASADAQLSESRIDHLIFEPGFSTADAITDVSGRGVGMDVVKEAVGKLKGRVEVSSTRGKGCRFVMRLPLTLAIVDGIIVRIGEDRYIIPTAFVKETLRPRQKDILTVHKKGELVKIRDAFLPLIRSHRLFGKGSQEREPWESLLVVIESNGLQKCLMVDDLVGKQEVVIKSLGEILKEVKGVAGAAILGDGKVGLILDIDGVFEMDQHPPGQTPFRLFH